MGVDTYVTIPKPIAQQGSSFTATVNFRLVDAAATPTTVRYRIDDDFTGDEIRCWTPIISASSIDFTITPDDNRIASVTRKEERRQLTIEIDTGFDTQARELVFWTVNRMAGVWDYSAVPDCIGLGLGWDGGTLYWDKVGNLFIARWS